MTPTNIPNMSYDEITKSNETIPDAEALQQMLDSVRYTIKEMSGYIDWDYCRELQRYERAIENKLKEVK